MGNGTGLVGVLDRRFYPGVGSHWDDTLFRQRVLEVMRPTDVVLDLGAGAGIIPQMNFRGVARRICGVDPDPRVTANPYLDEGRVGTGEAIPYADGTFDLVVADNVLEHLAEPADVFREVRRVLKPGGRFLFKTPNRFHYVPMIATFTPHWFHQLYNRLRGREAEDTFPTWYRANSDADVRRLAREVGLDVEGVSLVESRPEYLRLSAPSYVAGIAYERIVNATDAFRRFRVLLVGQCRRPY
jgi:SAM-dependent methyltransferase